MIAAGGGIGSFTTFSTWILDSHRLAEAGHSHLVWLNIGLSLLAGFAAIALGHWLGELLWAGVDGCVCAVRHSL